MDNNFVAEPDALCEAYNYLPNNNRCNLYRNNGNGDSQFFTCTGGSCGWISSCFVKGST